MNSTTELRITAAREALLGMSKSNLVDLLLQAEIEKLETERKCDAWSERADEAERILASIKATLTTVTIPINDTLSMLDAVRVELIELRRNKEIPF